MDTNSGEGDVDRLLSSIDSASQRMLLLTEMKKSVRKMNVELSVSIAKSRMELNSHFSEMKTKINEILDSRLFALLSDVSAIETETTAQFNSYEDEIQQCLDETKNVMEEGKAFLKNDPDKCIAEITAFRKNADRKLRQKLPEPPSGDPCTSITVDLPSLLPSILTRLSQHGDVISRIPIRISSVGQRPGGLHLSWQETCSTEDDSAGGEMAEYKLQMAEKQSDCFADVYQGAHTQYQVRGLKVGTRYKFRVSGRADGSEKWSPFSDVQSATVQDRHHEWSSDTADFAVTDENTVATRLATHDDPSTVRSSAASYTCGHQMAIRVLESGPSRASALIGLSTEPCDEFVRQGVLCINSAGNVHVNGSEMVTKLPPLAQGSCLNISSEVLSPAKVRVTLEVDDRAVTLDWKIAEDEFSVPGLSEVSAQQKLYYALRCRENGWSFLVE